MTFCLFNYPAVDLSYCTRRASYHWYKVRECPPVCVKRCPGVMHYQCSWWQYHWNLLWFEFITRWVNWKYFYNHEFALFLVSCMSTNYIHSVSRGSTLVGISPQSDAFLVEGQQKNFTCDSVGKPSRLHAHVLQRENQLLYCTYIHVPPYSWNTIGDDVFVYRWYQRASEGATEYDYVCEKIAGRSCNYSSSYQLIFRKRT